MMVLEGTEGIGKSSALRTLAGEWFSDTPLDLNSKDTYQALRGMWVLELAELDSLERAAASRVKAFCSSPVDRYRPSYGRMTQDFPRQCVFAGTTNEREYLTADHGNRRFWPVTCGRIDLEALARNRDQLLAEALHLYREGTTWWIDSKSDIATFAREQQAEREVHHPWLETARAYLEGRDRARIPDFLEHLAIPHGQQHRGHQREAGKVFRKLGWGKTRTKTEKFWTPKKGDQ